MKEKEVVKININHKCPFYLLKVDTTTKFNELVSHKKYVYSKKIVKHR
jgi:hypothetical protein